LGRNIKDFFSSGFFAEKSTNSSLFKPCSHSFQQVYNGSRGHFSDLPMFPAVEVAVASSSSPPRPPNEVDEWLAAARFGASDALGHLLESCRQYLLSVANAELDSRLRNKAGASDLVQETFLEAQRIFDRFGGGSLEELRPWLRAILCNKLATFTRSYRCAAKRRIDYEVDLSGTAAGQEPADPIPSPSSLMMRAEQATVLMAALGSLPESYRQVIVWRQLDDLSFETMAGRLGRSEAAVRKLWWRALQHLQRVMGEAL
jgi:RNA polymerase sigma-70 factor, ECF subfamily